MSAPPPVICVAGKNEIAVNAVLHLIDLGLRERIVVCPNCRDSGSAHWQPSLTRLALELGIEVISLPEAESKENLIFISLEFDRIVKPRRFLTNRLFNIHFSRLPAYKGVYTSAHPILRGEVRSGVTLHEIDHGIDTGAIIAQKEFSISADWTARDLYFRYMSEGYALFVAEIQSLLASDNPTAFQQGYLGSSYFGLESIDYATLKLNLRDTAEGIIRQLRAFSFREFQTPTIGGFSVGAWKVLNTRSVGRPGSVRAQGQDSLVVSSIDYDLLLVKDKSLGWFEVDEASSEDKMKELQKDDLDNRNRQGWTPLIIAAYSGNAALVRRLLSYGADPNKTNPHGTTPLMYAFSSLNENRKDEVIEELVSHGADSSRRDIFGKSLTDYHR